MAGQRISEGGGQRFREVEVRDSERWRSDSERWRSRDSERWRSEIEGGGGQIEKGGGHGGTIKKGLTERPRLRRRAVSRGM